MNNLMQDQLETNTQELDGLLSTIRTSFSSAAREASITTKRKESERELANMKPILEHLLHRLADIKTEDSEEISKMEMNASLEGTLSRMSQFLSPKL
jgi:hypothetical protein